MSAYKSRKFWYNNICKTREYRFSLKKEGEVMKGMTSAEVIAKLAVENSRKEIYMMSIDAKNAGKTFDDFIEELKVLAYSKK